MHEKISVQLETECPKCGMIVSYSVREPNAPMGDCPFCGAALRAPNPRGIAQMLEQRRIKAERDEYMRATYGHIRPEDMTDELRERRKRDEQKFQDALDEVTPCRFGTVADMRRKFEAALRPKEQ